MNQHTFATEAEADHRRRELMRAAAADAQASQARPQIGRRRRSPLPHLNQDSPRRAALAADVYMAGVRGANVATRPLKEVMPL
jgi:hypothetical protein